MSEMVTVPPGSTIGNCPACGFVIDGNVRTDGCETGFECGRCGSYTPNEPTDLNVHINLDESSVADPDAIADKRGETAT